MRRYLYNGIEYRSERQVRQAIFQAERKAFPSEPKENKSDFWERYGVVYSETEVQLTQERLAQQMRSMRDRLLSASDYYVMPDYPSTTQGLIEVKAYRQTLRDITKQENFPAVVSWPSVPSVLK